MAQLQQYGRTQIGGACTPEERYELDQNFFDLSPEEALETLNKLQETKLGNYEYTLAIGRLYKRLLYMQEHGFPPEPNNAFWKHVQDEADELDLSNVEYMRRAMQHIEQRKINQQYHCTEFEIQFMQKPALWWKRLFELTRVLDEILYREPVPLTMLKRVLSDAAIEKLSDPLQVKELLEDHLIFAHKKVVETFRETRGVSWVTLSTYEQLGFEIDTYGWIRRSDPSVQRLRARVRQTQEQKSTGFVGAGRTGRKTAKKGWNTHRKQRPY